jgi:hypothetical protein
MIDRKGDKAYFGMTRIQGTDSTVVDVVDCGEKSGLVDFHVELESPKSRQDL